MTPKQYSAIKNVMKSNDKIGKAMIDAGYAPSSANTPKVLTESKAWQEVMAEHLKDDKLFTKHEEALDATKWNDFTGEREADHNIRLKAVMEGYKLKGYIKEGINVQGDLNMSVTIVRHAVE